MTRFREICAFDPETQTSTVTRAAYTPEEEAEADAEDAASSPPSPVVTPTVWAAAYMLDVVDGEVRGAENAARIWAVFYIDVGQYLVYFDAPPGAVSYFPYPYDDSVFMRAPREARGENWFTVEAKDASGNYVDPESFSVEVKIIS